LTGLLRLSVAIGVGLLWLATGAALSSRMQLVFDYATFPSVPPAYEVLAAPVPALWVLSVSLVLIWFALWLQPSADHNRMRWILFFHLIACIPFLLMVGRSLAIPLPECAWWEPILFAVASGFGIRCLVPRGARLVPSPHGWQHWQSLQPWSWPALGLLAAGCAFWWYWQAADLFAQYQLGFNDFGHFTQRIANTARGHGFLLESPVLPPFWDHFNPGLVLLVPGWLAYPDVHGIFALQSVCLAGSALGIAAIAKAKGADALQACVWGCAWLMLPAIGQMNLAYTYGWHPITLAIPCMLGSYWCLISGRCLAAIGLAVLAASFEEGVLIALGCFAVAMGLREWASRASARDPEAHPPLDWRSARVWFSVACVAFLGFAIVYRWSGLAEFQTARFARLGNHAWEIALSPFLKPEAFWGLLARPRNLAYLGFLLAPFAVAASKPWLWYLLGILPPLGVLLIWEHMPAQSIAFQYASCLLPIVSVGLLERPEKIGGDSGSQLGAALGMLMAGVLLSIYVGQMPWSLDSLIDVKAKTYGATAKFPRSHGSEDQQWLTEQIQTLRLGSHGLIGAERADGNSLRILATGRIASHWVGARDLETVGQFWQRYDALQKLQPELSTPLLRFDVLLLDFRESFQQSLEETQRVKDEAILAGFQVSAAAHGIEILIR